jgi:hypothetical protein
MGGASIEAMKIKNIKTTIPENCVHIIKNMHSRRFFYKLFPLLLLLFLLSAKICFGIEFDSASSGNSDDIGTLLLVILK